MKIVGRGRVRRVFENIHSSLKVFYPFVSDRDYCYHHGVLLDDVPRNGGSFQVIHFSGQTINDAKPCLICIDQFQERAVDGKLCMAQYNNPALDVEETLRRAENVLRGADRRLRFDIIDNNCESLATWLKTRRAYSIQGRNGIIRASLVSTCNATSL